jgi:hypothetical protein
MRRARSHRSRHLLQGVIATMSANGDAKKDALICTPRSLPEQGVSINPHMRLVACPHFKYMKRDLRRVPNIEV